MSRMSGILILSYRLKEVTILMFFIVFKLQRMFVSLQPDVRLRWGLDHTVAFQMDK